MSDARVEISRDANLKILHVIPAIARRYGGPSTVIWPLVEELNRLKGVRAEIATTDSDGAGGRLSAGDFPNSAAIRVFRRTCSERWKFSVALFKWLGRNAGEYDLLHIHAVWSFSTAAAARAAENHGVPYLVRPAGMLSEYSWNHRGWNKRLYWRWVEQRTIQRAAGIHATSEAEAREIRDIRPDARVFVIPNAVDDAAFIEAVNRTKLRDICGSGPSRLPIVLFLSRLHPKKGIVDLLLPALAAMRTPCVLAIAGGADSHSPDHELAVSKTVDAKGLNSRVALLGNVAANERWAMYDGADAFVLPSHSENFGIVVAEAMARGCPVVVTDAVQCAGHIKKAGAGEVVSRNAEELARALDGILTQPERKHAYGAAGKRYAEKHFRWEHVARQLSNVYRECRSNHKELNNK